MFKFMYFNIFIYLNFIIISEWEARPSPSIYRDDNRCISRLIVIVDYAFTIKETSGRLCLRELKKKSKMAD